jgi:hypothetical protein
VKECAYFLQEQQLDLTEFELPIPILGLNDRLELLSYNSAALEAIPELEGCDHLTSLIVGEDQKSFLLELNGAEDNFSFRGRVGAQPSIRWFEFRFGRSAGARICVLRDINDEVRSQQKESREKEEAYARL